MVCTKAYTAWVNMRQRCTNSKNVEFFRYGGDGITIDPLWETFEGFYKSMGSPEDGLSLDRIDPRGNYEPDNCRWAEKRLQSFNTKLKVTNTSGKSGVKEYKGSRWRAFIGFEGQQLHLGYFTTYSEAVAARESAELKYYGFIKE